jgi:hypothetical protein
LREPFLYHLGRILNGFLENVIYLPVLYEILSNFSSIIFIFLFILQNNDPFVKILYDLLLMR